MVKFVQWKTISYSKEQYSFIQTWYNSHSRVGQSGDKTKGMFPRPRSNSKDGHMTVHVINRMHGNPHCCSLCMFLARM